MHKHAFPHLWRDRERKLRSYSLATGTTAFLVCAAQRVYGGGALCQQSIPGVSDSHNSWSEYCPTAGILSHNSMTWAGEAICWNPISRCSKLHLKVHTMDLFSIQTYTSVMANYSMKGRKERDDSTGCYGIGYSLLSPYVLPSRFCSYIAHCYRVFGKCH